MKKEKKPRGRPTKFTKALGDRIIEKILTPMSVTAVCKLPEFPVISTVLGWVLKGEAGDKVYREFSKQYALALDMRAEMYFEEATEIADDVSAMDSIQTKFGPKANKEWISRSRLRVETRLRAAAQQNPKKYSERLKLEHAGKDGGAIESKQTIVTTYIPDNGRD